MPTQTADTLTALIAQSLLLSPERKEELLAALPMLTGKQEKELLRILQSEDDILGDLAKKAITRAVERGDTGFLKELEEFLSDAMRRLRPCHSLRLSESSSVSYPICQTAQQA